MSTFDQARAYDENSSEQKRIGMSLIKLLSPCQGWKVLDIGCGTGGLTKILADSVGPQGKVVAIDPDSERLEIARAKHSSTNITYIEGTAEKLPVDDYDLVYSNLVFHWIKDRDMIFKQASTLLKKGKLLAFTAGVEHNREKTAFPKIENCVSDEFKESFLGQFYYLPDQEIHQHSAKYGFKIQHLNEVEVPLTFKNMDQLVEFYRTHGIGKNFSVDHFNVAAMKEAYREESCVISMPTAVVILQKQ